MLGRYAILGRLGEGGMGIVFRAYDPKLHREVALKSLKPGLLSAELQARMVREARAMAKLQHPNVVSVYDVEIDGDTVTLAMEFVDGSTIDQWQREHALSPRGILDLYIQAGRGLAADPLRGPDGDGSR